jgi:hypothetical protein
VIDFLARTEAGVPQALRTRVRRTLWSIHDGVASEAEIEQLARLLQKSPELAAFARRVVELQAMLADIRY